MVDCPTYHVRESGVTGNTANLRSRVNTPGLRVPVEDAGTQSSLWSEQKTEE